MPRDPKMDAAYFWTFPPKPQGGAKAQKMLPKVAGVKGGKRGAQRSIFQVTERKRKIKPRPGLRRKASAHTYPSEATGVWVSGIRSCRSFWSENVKALKEQLSQTGW